MYCLYCLYVLFIIAYCIHIAYAPFAVLFANVCVSVWDARLRGTESVNLNHEANACTNLMIDRNMCAFRGCLGQWWWVRHQTQHSFKSTTN